VWKEAKRSTKEEARILTNLSEGLKKMTLREGCWEWDGSQSGLDGAA
jgi:hypothetical protein